MNGLTGVVADLYNAIEPDIKVMPAKGKFFVADAALMHKIKSTSGVGQVAQCLSDNALIKGNDKQAIVTVKGVDENFINVTRFDSVIQEGNYTLKSKDAYFAIFGRGLASQLQININNLIEQISIYSPKRGATESINPDDNFNQKYVFPSGTFSLNDDFDFKLSLIHIYLDRLLGIGLTTSLPVRICFQDGSDRHLVGAYL